LQQGEEEVNKADYRQSYAESTRGLAHGYYLRP
jgi:hypothetical protein